jgi:glycine betaine/proline transport system substrate-binding protein
MSASSRLFVYPAMRTALAILALLAGTFAGQAARAATPACEVNRPIRFSGLNWESNLMMVGIERSILEKGYGCKTTVEQGETVAMLAALERGDVDITPEVWPGQIQEAWGRAVASGKVVAVGHAFDAGEGWYIPRYTADRHPDLKKASDLARFQTLFADPEDPGKGRIYGCPAGWVCGTLNDNLQKALGLDKTFNMFAPGAGAAQKAAIVSAYKRHRDIVFYYWTPTPLVGALDLVRLELPAFNQAAYTCLVDPNCQHPVATDFKSQAVVTGMNAAFAAKAPALRAFFEALHMPQDVLRDSLGWMEKEGKEPEDAADYFMKQHPDVWKKWLPADVAQRVQLSL